MKAEPRRQNELDRMLRSWQEDQSFPLIQKSINTQANNCKTNCKQEKEKNHYNLYKIKIAKKIVGHY